MHSNICGMRVYVVGNFDFKYTISYTLPAIIAAIFKDGGR